LRETTLVQGRLVKVDRVDRGNPVSVSEEDMRSRWWMRHRRNLLVIELVVWATIAVQYTRGALSVEYVLLFGAVFVTSVLVGYLLMQSRAPPGLYSNGVQHPQAYFIPFWEIGDVKVRERALGVSGPVVRLVPRFTGGTWDWDYYEIPIGLLGEGGVETIVERIATSAPPGGDDSAYGSRVRQV
jgi:hypothetical protein